MSVMEVTPSRLRLDLATLGVLWRRDVVRFFRQRSRVVGALAQPILFWVVIGGGFAGTFRLPGAEGVSYQQFFFPGVVAMVVLFSAIFATITVIDDRQQGFLQSVLAGPGSRLSVALGKMVGSSTVALIQAGLFLLFAPLAGVHLGAVNWPLLASALVFSALALTGLGFTLAWWINSSTGYHAVMSVVLIPMWVLSGAMFPIQSAHPVLAALMTVNPMRFTVEAIRRSLYGDEAVAITSAGSTGRWELLGLAVFAALMVTVATWRVSRRE